MTTLETKFGITALDEMQLLLHELPEVLVAIETTIFDNDVARAKFGSHLFGQDFFRSFVACDFLIQRNQSEEIKCNDNPTDGKTTNAMLRFRAAEIFSQNRFIAHRNASSIDANNSM